MLFQTFHIQKLEKEFPHKIYPQWHLHQAQASNPSLVHKHNLTPSTECDSTRRTILHSSAVQPISLRLTQAIVTNTT